MKNKLEVDGSVFGYEALSRITDPKLALDIETMFSTADQIGKAWELEAFFKSINHYKEQDYGIAIDDVGSGFSGLNVIIDAGNVFPSVESICKLSTVVPPEKRAVEVYEMLVQNPSIMEVCITQNDKPVGFMTRGDILAVFGGRFGYDLNLKKKIKEIMNTEFLRVNFSVPIDKVSRLAMQRSHERLYDPVVVEKENGYLGIVTVKDLLDSCTKIQVDSAMHSNPLTGLPGNHQIEKEILRRLFGESPYCITYYDLDNFKAYNDTYGFGNGDRMLAMVAGILKDCARNGEFVGHIGGDDFVVVCDYHDCSNYCRQVIDTFSSAVLSLYNSTDITRQFIISKNRHGVTEQYPLAGISIAGITNRNKQYQSIQDFSEDIAALKKLCKAKSGSCFQIV